MRQTTQGVKEAAAEVRNFLANSKRERKENSGQFKREIQARVKEIKKSAQDFILDSAARRTAVFQEMMQDIGRAPARKETAAESAPKKRGRKGKAQQ